MKDKTQQEKSPQHEAEGSLQSRQTPIIPQHTGLDGSLERLIELFAEASISPTMFPKFKALISRVKEEGKEIGYELRDQEYAITLTGVIKKVKEERNNELRGIIEGMRYDDPIKGEHNHPGQKWTDCEACKENYHHNATLDSLLTHLNKEPLT